VIVCEFHLTYEKWRGAEKRISISREISKLHEETIRGTVEEVIAHFVNKAPKGEMVVVVVEGKGKK